jgi:hypothetical protein
MFERDVQGEPCFRLRSQASRWEDGVPEGPGLSRELSMQHRLIDVMSLSKTSLKMFDGNPLCYWEFVNAFDSCVGNLSVDDGAKLIRLFE